MSYIEKNLLPGERIIFRTKKHLIIFFLPMVALVLASLAAIYMTQNPVLQFVQWVPWLLIALIWGAVGLNYYFSEFAVTNKRVMMREGFFTRHSNELRLTAVSQVNVDQDLLGQILNYGTVSINAFGAFDRYTIIAQPGKFQQAVNQQIDLAGK
jgi:uncharacterized membrane protein YdbT with pleckstrin-like domain